MSHRDPVECSGLLTRSRLTHYGYRLTVLRNEVSDTDCSSLNWSDRRHSLVWTVNDISLLANSLWPPARRAADWHNLIFTVWSMIFLIACSTFWELSSSFCLNFEVLIFRWFWCLKSDPFWFFWFFAPWKMILWFFVLRFFDFVQCFDFNTFKTWSLILIYTTVDFFGSCKRCFPWDLPTKTKSSF